MDFKIYAQEIICTNKTMPIKILNNLPNQGLPQHTPCDTIKSIINSILILPILILISIG